MSRATRKNVDGKPRIALTKHALRTAIRQDPHVLDKIDRRSAAMRRLRNLVGNHVADLGGEANVSHAERILVNRAAMLCLLCEMQEEQFVRANLRIPPTELQSYMWTNGALTRILTSLGLKRRPKDVTPSLEEYCAERYGTQDANEPTDSEAQHEDAE